ncbi:hypothetical protein [Kiritimatiella glycovorans]|jgi:hypothetical protein|uniref:Lipoprotein n=1 Tax=Kiritimatiella glycovorans TaxID=1307763 RepID=A0A0G3EL14_9BACT|nr:hypothetical protein [Kiritimatiella glycovorans]AKJ64814.1 hypothetical protein L21SP4_01571 [Kiritimatiella glycovorans]
MKKRWLGLMVVAAMVVGVGCGKKAEQGSVEPVAVPKAFVSEEPAGEPTPIPEARKLPPGTDVLLKGLVMGVRSPFVEGRALFILGDEATITPCNAKDDDHCSMPWDACCDPLEVRAAGTAAIQVLDDTGEVLEQGLKGVNGLKELSRVTVAGAVAPHSTTNAFVVNAASLYVEPEASNQPEAKDAHATCPSCPAK